MRLIYYEIKKFYSSSFLKVLFLLLLAGNIILCANSLDISDDPQDVRLLREIYAQYKNDPEGFSHRFEQLREYYENTPFDQIGDPDAFYGGEGYREYWTYKDVLTCLEADDAYHDKLETLLLQTGGIISSMELSGMDRNSYQYRYQKEVFSRYSRLQAEVKLNDRPVYGWISLFSYGTDFYLILLLVLVCAAFAALNDRQNGFYAISGLCRRGRGASVMAKYLALLVLTGGILLVFSLSDVLTIAWRCGLSDGSNAIQSLRAFSLCPLPLSLLGGYLVSFCWKLLAVVLCASVAFGLAILCKRSALALGLGAGFVLVNDWVSTLESAGASQWKNCNLRFVFSPQGMLGRFRSVDLFSHVADLQWLIPALFLFVSLLMLCLALFFYPRSGLPKLGKKLALRFPAFSRGRAIRSLSLSFYEWFKVRLFYVVLIVLIAAKLALSADYYSPDLSSYDRMYRQYFNKIGGMYTEEKVEFLQEEAEFYAQVTGQMDEMGRLYFNNEISSETFKAFMRNYAAAELKEKVLTQLQGQAAHLKTIQEKTGVTGSFVYETGYRRLATQGVDWLLVAFVCLFALRFYLKEYETTPSGSPMIALAQTTAKGREALYARKLTLCLGTAAMAWILFMGIDYYFLLRSFELPDMTAPLASLSFYPSALGRISILGYTVGVSLISLLGTLLLAAGAFTLALLVKRMFLVYALTAAALLIPHTAANSGVSFCRWIDLTLLYDTDRLFRQASLPVFLLFLAVVVTILAVAVFYSLKKVKRGDLI